MKNKIKLGLIGGGPGSWIGNVHRIASRLDDEYEIVKYVLPSFKIHNLFKNYALSTLFTIIINYLFNRKNSYIITIAKSIESS